jgi:hypothetical protein
LFALVYRLAATQDVEVEEERNRGLLVNLESIAP